MDTLRPPLRLVLSKRPADTHVERALTAMKSAPTRRWTVASLARLAGLSRAPFARRFTRATGLPPLQWLAAHRIQIARARLVETDETLAVIAGEVGYACEFAFAKAFKRLLGIAPGTFRRIARGELALDARFRAAA